MIKTKKLFVLALAAGSLTLAGCNAIFGTADKAKDETKDADTKTNDAAQQASDLTTFDDNGHFRNEKTYHFTNNEAGTQVDYKFETNGKLTTKDVATNETFEYTYKAISNLIEIKDSKDKIQYIDFYDDVLYHPVNFASSSREGYATFVGGAIGYRDGVTISSRGTSVIGYHIDLQASVGDTKAVFSREKETSKGIAYPIFANATFEASLKNSKVLPVDDSMITQGVIDTTKTGNQVIDVVVNKKTYKAVLRVAAAAQSAEGEAVNSDGHFKTEKIFHFLSTVDGKKMEYAFETSGALTTKNVWTEETTSYTYKVIDNLIEVKDSSNNVTYFDYYENLLAHPVYNNAGEFTDASVGYLDGYAAALQSSSTVSGYHFELNVSVGDTKSVFDSSKSRTKGFAYPIYANATFKNDKSASAVKGVDDSWFGEEIDTADAGSKIVELTYNSKTYKAVLKVA